MNPVYFGGLEPLLLKALQKQEEKLDVTCICITFQESGCPLLLEQALINNRASVYSRRMKNIEVLER